MDAAQNAPGRADPHCATREAATQQCIGASAENFCATHWTARDRTGLRLGPNLLHINGSRGCGARKCTCTMVDMTQIDAYRNQGRDNLAPESSPTIDPLERLLELSSEMQTVWTEAARNSRRRRIFARLFRKE